MWAVLKELDIFGIPVSLTHRGKETFSTSFGTILTFIFMFVICSKGLSDFMKVWNAEVSNVSSQLIYADPEKSGK